MGTDQSAVDRDGGDDTESAETNGEENLEWSRFNWYIIGTFVVLTLVGVGLSVGAGVSEAVGVAVAVGDDAPGPPLDGRTALQPASASERTRAIVARSCLCTGALERLLGLLGGP